MPLELVPDQEGLQKLAEYLAQTRRQAEQAIDVLNKTILELQEENTMLRKNCEEYMNENSCEQLKLENSKKWRLQERDDWKALVDSVQRDRTRLQQENLALETEVSNCKHIIEELQLQLAQMQQVPNSTPRSPHSDAIITQDGIPSLALDIQPPSSPSISARNTPMTPNTTSRTLKLELERTREQMSTLQHTLDEEKLRSESEIHKLKDELHRVRTLVSRQSSSGSEMPPEWPGFYGYYNSMGEKVVRKGRDILTL